MYSTNSVRMSRSGGMVGDLADTHRPKRMHVSDGTDVRGVRCGCEYRPIRAANDGHGGTEGAWKVCRDELLTDSNDCARQADYHLHAQS